MRILLSTKRIFIFNIALIYGSITLLKLLWLDTYLEHVREFYSVRDQAKVILWHR
jgi:hypothetical protein